MDDYINSNPHLSWSLLGFMCHSLPAGKRLDHMQPVATPPPSALSSLSPCTGASTSRGTKFNLCWNWIWGEKPKISRYQAFMAPGHLSKKAGFACDREPSSVEHCLGPGHIPKKKIQIINSKHAARGLLRLWSFCSILRSVAAPVN